MVGSVDLQQDVGENSKTEVEAQVEVLGYLLDLPRTSQERE